MIILGAVLFSTGGAAIKACGFSGPQVAGLRSIIAALTILILVPSARNFGNWRTWIVGLAYAGIMVTYTVANKHTTAASAVFLQSTAPLYILLLGPFLLKEPIRWKDLAFLVPMAVGLGIFFVGRESALKTAPDPFLGNLFGMASGISWALTIMGLRWLGRGEGEGPGSAASAVFSGNVITFLIALPWVFSGGGGGTQDWLLVSYLGIFQVAVAYVFMTAALRRLPALEGSLFLLVEPVLNPVWSFAVHGEKPGAWPLCGGALILTTTALRTILGVRKSGNPKTD